MHYVNRAIFALLLWEPYAGYIHKSTEAELGKRYSVDRNRNYGELRIKYKTRITEENNWEKFIMHSFKERKIQVQHWLLNSTMQIKKNNQDNTIFINQIYEYFEYASSVGHVNS